jgi:hypothetical protein
MQNNEDIMTVKEVSILMSDHIRELYERFVDLPFPKVGYEIGNFPLFDGLVAGSASSYLQGAPVHPAGIDNETRKDILSLRSKSQLSDDERYFLEYFNALEELRLAVQQELGIDDTTMEKP